MSSNRLLHRQLQRLLIYSTALSLSGSFSFAQEDEPDLRKEQQLYNIYRQYNLRPTSEENWKGVLSNKTRTYGVQDGDTLWDLSETLFGDANFWPKVWSINSKKIENPHEIFPGQTVFFTPGTTGEAPSVTVADEAPPETEEQESEEAEAPAEEKPAKASKNPLLAQAQLPPEPKTKKATAIPKSLPTWTYGRIKVDQLFEAQRINRNFQAASEPLPYFIADRVPDSVGVVSETEMQMGTVSEFQYLYVKLPKGVNAKNLLAFKAMGQVKDPFVPKDSLQGTLIQVQGEIEVLEKVNDSEDIYRAIAKKLVNPIEVGANLIVGNIPTFNTRNEGVSEADAHIIGGANSTERFLFGTQSIVFLSGQGLGVGQTYPIYKKLRVRSETTKVVQNPRQIGQLKVVKVSDRFATAVILQSNEEVRVGDMTISK